ncbi:hypothetical protein GPECTOR_11g94 [Gonium pectorale]|uniref:Protein kinase domain-containing protein n=1 Tax=Gonium pectorale TaxID=33097 RepID=A0A150GQF3_GONPE|nr:hypothetical protein GPECTOR_11g94 [Gonium pectorale]|eukprot:KXZ51972.1 hypothetical protein GPECTOR_11g94 [Gonium pectorale]
MEDVGTPVDLQEAYMNSNHSFHRQAKEVVAQIYTYLLTWRICHGFISCWNATWLVYVSPDDRTVVHLSEPFLATAGSGSERRATMVGALSWQQLQALLFACGDQSAALLPGTAAAGGGEGASGGAGDRAGPDAPEGGSGSGAGTSEATASPDSTHGDTSGGSLAASCGLLRRDAVAAEPSGSVLDAAATAAAARAPPASGADLPPPATSVRLRCLDLLAEGGDGTVFSGTCNGAPAVIKVYTWEAYDQAAYWREVQAYRALAQVQGSSVPQMLSHGTTETNLRYIALRPMEGSQRLSDCVRPFSRAVAVAALRALQDVQAACPGFVHGDLELENMLLVPGAAGTSGGAVEAGGASYASSGTAGDGGGAPRCVLLDFARSRLDGDEQQRERERAELKQLLGLEA